MIETIVNFEKMDELVIELTRIKTELTNNFSDLNTNFKSIDTNWDGKKSKDVLNPVDGIISQNNKILENIESNIAILKEAVNNYRIKTSGEVAAIPLVLSAITPEREQYRTPYYSQNMAGMTNITYEQLKSLGVKFDNNNLPIKVQNAYVANLGGMNYLISFPTDSNGQTQKNLPVYVEFHGHSASSKYTSFLPSEDNPNAFVNGPVMGLRQTATNPNFQAIIIMPQSSLPGFVGDNIGQLHNIYSTVANTFDTNDQGFTANVFSAGGAGFYRYNKEYSSDVKAAYIVDPTTEADYLQNVPEDKPVYVITSTKTNSEDSSTYRPKFEKAAKALKRPIDFLPSIPKDNMAQLYNIIENNDTSGFKLVTIPETSHEELRNIFFTPEFFDISLKAYYSNYNMSASSMK